jgi:hypothetical protein
MTRLNRCCRRRWRHDRENRREAARGLGDRRPWPPAALAGSPPPWFRRARQPGRWRWPSVPAIRSPVSFLIATTPSRCRRPACGGHEVSVGATGLRRATTAVGATGAALVSIAHRPARCFAAGRAQHRHHSGRRPGGARIQRNHEMSALRASSATRSSTRSRGRRGDPPPPRGLGKALHQLRGSMRSRMAVNKTYARAVFPPR